MSVNWIPSLWPEDLEFYRMLSLVSLEDIRMEAETDQEEDGYIPALDERTEVQR